MLTIDGAEGEGGGQILRSALTLSMLTGTPFRIENIRAGRSKPGLLRQHLAAVRAAAQICGGDVKGAELGATALDFVPGTITPGDYHFAIGSAGAACLVFQTIFLPLARQATPSRVVIEGGTHNISAPSFEYLDRVFLPAVRPTGFEARLTLCRHGFHPAGGGKLEAVIGPVRPAAKIMLEDRGALLSRQGEAVFANLAVDIARREAVKLTRLLSLSEDEVKIREVESSGPGNILWIEIRHERAVDIFSAHGAFGVTSEEVAVKVARQVEKYMASEAAVGPHIADQLLMPLALARGGRFTTLRPTPHTRSNIAVIEQFLPVEITIGDTRQGDRLIVVVV
ncbi:RNA 3'-terminal phosphate cyclase [Taklimakanibacter albus]|uniref:RNA 3'-terminal phosphate cyclase n=1 Tax=Taklimakanibacter albus TaxID=2800327 RepID=A0ACC5RF08_9HYPH|nr:RNA 3'-terminal phosphate cyclase [Aestuariivirga sp. YIM B02566]MBK1871286.1 RNA 3'-terminal phosphate cyclase [Aestuariivirga sp. YIM B02566]